ncbi:hypothetical protein, partial [Edaphobacter aggregans]|uniref:hypothetical protein n=1 Tax=Edaphobacter aggregans TaxID=570835 RepID=UPI001B8001D7
MESMEIHEAGFPPFPHPLEMPAGIPNHYHGYGDYHLSEYRQSPPQTRNQSHFRRKGLVNHVSGLKRKGCPGTLTLTPPGPLDHGLRESKGCGLSCPHPLESPSSVPAWADTCWQL